MQDQTPAKPLTGLQARPYPEQPDLEVALVSPTDGTINRVTDDDLDQRYVAWSPDGDQLIYTADQVPAVNEQHRSTRATARPSPRNRPCARALGFEQ